MSLKVVQGIMIERIPHNGHLVLSDIVNGQYIKQTYIGYTQKEAISLFRQYRRECKND